MVSTVFVDQSTVIEASWLNDVNTVVYDNYSGVIANVRAHGAVGDGVTDDTAAIQATIALVEASLTGGVVYLPPGNFKITSNLTVTWPKLCVIRGAGSKITNILDYRTAVTTGGGITYDASVAAGGDDAYMATWTGGFTLTKSVNMTIVTGLVIATLGTGVGLYCNGVVGGVYADIAVHGYETNIYMVDCLGFAIRDVYTNQCNSGIYLAGYSSLSAPNSSTVQNVIASACGLWGLYINGGEVQVLGGTYSDCGTMATVSGGIYQLTDSSVGLPKTLTVQAVWFERNRGSADVYIKNAAATTTPGSVSISNSLFSRIDSTYHTTNNIYVLNDGNAVLQLESANNGFQGYNTYIASAARKYIALGGTYLAQVATVYTSNTFNDSTESPVTQSNAANVSSLGFGAAAGQLGDVTGTPTLYSGGTSVGIGNNSGYGMVLDATAWRPSVASVFSLGTITYPVNNVVLSGTAQFGTAAIYIGHSGSNLDLAGTAGVVPGIGISPASNNAQYLGGSSLRWTNVYSVLGNFSGAITWGAYSIAVPAGGTETFLGNDGTWKMPGVSSTFTGTATGFSGAAPTAAFNYTKIGSVVTLEFGNITGTSNATTFTVTGLPAALWPVSAKRICLVGVADNGTSAVGIMRIMQTGVLEIYAGVGALVFTASGTKALEEGSITYTIV